MHTFLNFRQDWNDWHYQAQYHVKRNKEFMQSTTRFCIWQGNGVIDVEEDDRSDAHGIIK